MACLGIGTALVLLNNKHLILDDVLHVPKLRSLLLSVRCFQCLVGCSFIADNMGSFLTFHLFILPVDDSSGCTISGSLTDKSTDPDFDCHLVGSISAVSDNTRYHQQ